MNRFVPLEDRRPLLPSFCSLPFLSVPFLSFPFSSLSTLEQLTINDFVPRTVRTLVKGGDVSSSGNWDSFFVLNSDNRGDALPILFVEVEIDASVLCSISGDTLVLLCCSMCMYVLRGLLHSATLCSESYSISGNKLLDYLMTTPRITRNNPIFGYNSPLNDPQTTS